MDSTTHGVPVRHSEELAKGENRDLYKEEVMQKLCNKSSYYRRVL